MIDDIEQLKALKEEYKKSVSALAFSESSLNLPKNIEVELRVWQSILNQTNTYFAEVHTTLDADRQLLQEHEEGKIVLSQNRHNSVQYLIQEKEIAHFYKQAAIIIIDALNNEVVDLEDYKNDIYFYENIRAYYNYLILPLVKKEYGKKEVK